MWYFGNRLLHDAFVLIKHKGKSDRELLRLLMGGQVLMLWGATVFVCWLMMLYKIQCGGLIAIILAAFMLVSCAMIFPFLKSVGTIVPRNYTLPSPHENLVFQTWKTNVTL